MLAHPHESILRACVLILTPNEVFKDWLKTSASVQRIPEATLDKLIHETSLYEHAVAFITPVFHGPDELSHFIEEHYRFISQSLLLAWPLSLEAWQENTNQENLTELFDASYYFYLVNVAGMIPSLQKEHLCSVTTLRPKAACLQWIHDHHIDELDDLELDLLRKFGVAFLTPSFQSPEEEAFFIQDHATGFWEAGLSCYSEEQHLWPENRSAALLLEWFSVETCYSVVDLNQVRLKKKVA